MATTNRSEPRTGEEKITGNITPDPNKDNRDIAPDPALPADEALAWNGEPEDASGLDIPGAELDNDMEETGSEDEENNYYSLGGERHEDLEEDR